MTLTDAGKKKEIFTNLHKLGNEETAAPRKDYKFDHDQTPQQRKELKEMIAKAKTLTEQDPQKKVRLVKGPPWNRRIVFKKKEEEQEDSQEEE